MMKRLILTFVGTFSILTTAESMPLVKVTAPPWKPPRDARFFGTYYGSFSTEVCKKYKVYFLGIPITSGTKCVTVDVTDITVHLDYRESPLGGSFSGSGVGTYENQEIPIAISGEILDHGKARGVVGVMTPELSTFSGDAFLSSDGLELTATAMGRTIKLRKDAGSNKAPNVVIESPANGAALTYGDTYVFKANVTDEDVSFPPERLVWESSKDGVLSGYSTFGPKTVALFPNNLSAGIHTITFSATDQGGLRGTQSVQVSVNNQPPDPPTIFKPQSNDLIYTSVSIVFLGQAYDLEDGSLGGTDLVWSSNVDGTIGYGMSVTKSLNTSGPHKIRLTATDQLGAVRYTERSINVLAYAGNSAPQVSIVKPEYYNWKGMAVVSGDEISFVGMVADKEDSIGSLTLKWQAFEVPPQGATFGQVFTFGGNSTLAKTAFPLIGGVATTYRITFSATDSGGLTGKDNMILVVIPHGID